jgi:hypothetical protein
MVRCDQILATEGQNVMSEDLGKDRELRSAGGDPGAATPPGHSGRRALIIGAAVAGAGAVVSLAGGMDPADAANGNPVELGKNNFATATTWVINRQGTALAARTSADGQSALTGINTIVGRGVSGAGVTGSGVDTNGVVGTSGNAAGVLGSGVVGVSGYSPSGVGVIGETDGSCGVSGSASFGIGVCGSSGSGPGVVAQSTQGTALQVVGKAEFSTSGVATVKKNTKTVTVTFAGVTTSSIVLATMQELHSGIGVAAAVPGSGSFTITLTGTAATDTRVGWFVIGPVPAPATNRRPGMPKTGETDAKRKTSPNTRGNKS